LVFTYIDAAGAEWLGGERDINITLADSDSNKLLIDAVQGDVTGIKGKTDSLTFTKAGEVDANIQSVNDISVTGDGEEGTEWGPQ